MNKVKVKNIIIAEKIYIDKLGVESVGDLQAAYTYVNGTELLSTLEESDTHFIVPSNSYHKLEWETLDDRRIYKKLDKTLLFSGMLRPEQSEAVEKLFIPNSDRARSGLLQAPTGWGKTFSGCNLIARNNTKTLVLVHTKLLFDQWLSEAEKQLPNAIIGKIGDGFYSIGDVTIAIYKTVYNNLDKLRDEFSTILIDETHKAPADMFSSVVNNLNARVKIGISATPRRKDGKHVYLADFFSPFKVVAEDSRILATPMVQIKQTDFKFTIINPKQDWAKAINKLCSDDSYINLIAETAISYIKQKRCPLIIAERVQMLETLQTLIPDSVCVIGKTSSEEREDALEGLGTKYKAILTTKLFDEGISCNRLDTLLLTCPSNNSVQWEQRIGRIVRLHPDKQLPLVVDFWLSGAIVSRQQKNRLAWYTERGYNIL